MEPRQLSDLYEIQLLKARYFRYLDTKEWGALRDLFTPDLQFFVDSSDVGESTRPRWDGADAMVADLRRADPQRVTVHHGHMPEIEFHGDDAATGIWAVCDLIDDPAKGRFLRGFGHYHERYVRCRDGRWRIESIRLTRLRVEEELKSCDDHSTAPGQGEFQ
jgi:hypothetical protein